MEILNSIHPDVIQEIENVLKRGQILILPTDTVYGLVCDARNRNAVNKIFAIKRRDLNKPIGIFVRDIRMAEEFAELDEEKRETLARFWPGKVTFILKKKRGLADNVGTEETIGMRMPAYKLIHDLFSRIDFPLAQSSANISNEPTKTRIQEIIDEFEDESQKPDLIINAGDLRSAPPSTVMDLTKEKPEILRQGEVQIRLN